MAAISSSDLRDTTALCAPLLRSVADAVFFVRRMSPYVPADASQSLLARVASAAAGASAAADAVAAAVAAFSSHAAAAVAAADECAALAADDGSSETTLLRVVTRVAATGFGADVSACGSLSSGFRSEEELWAALAFVAHGRGRRTPLMAAAACGSAARVAFLAARAGPTEPPPGCTPAARARIAATRAARLDARDAGGRSALMWAATQAKGSRVVAALLAAGAATSLLDASGLSPLAYARTCKTASLLLPLVPHSTLVRDMQQLPLRHVYLSIPALCLIVLEERADVLEECSAASDTIAQWYGVPCYNKSQCGYTGDVAAVRAAPALILAVLERHGDGGSAVAGSCARAIAKIWRWADEPCAKTWHAAALALLAALERHCARAAEPASLSATQALADVLIVLAKSHKLQLLHAPEALAACARVLALLAAALDGAITKASALGVGLQKTMTKALCAVFALTKALVKKCSPAGIGAFVSGGAPDVVMRLLAPYNCASRSAGLALVGALCGAECPEAAEARAAFAANRVLSRCAWVLASLEESLRSEASAIRGRAHERDSCRVCEHCEQPPYVDDEPWALTEHVLTAFQRCALVACVVAAVVTGSSPDDAARLRKACAKLPRALSTVTAAVKAIVDYDADGLCIAFNGEEEQASSEATEELFIATNAVESLIGVDTQEAVLSI